jgi:hypothetical protein
MNASIAAIVPPEIPGDDYFNNVIQGIWKLLKAEPTIPECKTTRAVESKVRVYSQKIQSFDRARPGELATEIIEWARDIATLCNRQFSAIMQRERGQELAGVEKPKAKKPKKKSERTIDQIVRQRANNNKCAAKKRAELEALKSTNPKRYDELVSEKKRRANETAAKSRAKLRSLKTTDPQRYDELVSEKRRKAKVYEQTRRTSKADVMAQKRAQKQSALETLKATDPQRYDELVSEKKRKEREYQHKHYAKKKAARELLKATDPEYVALTERVKAKEKAVIDQNTSILPASTNNDSNSVPLLHVDGSNHREST